MISITTRKYLKCQKNPKHSLKLANINGCVTVNIHYIQLHISSVIITCINILRDNVLFEQADIVPFNV